MSYSFQVRDASKAEALEKVKAELGKVVVAQPVHAVDERQAFATAESFVTLLADDVDRDVCVSVHGSVVVHENKLTNSGVGVSAWFVARE